MRANLVVLQSSVIHCPILTGCHRDERVGDPFDRLGRVRDGDSIEGDAVQIQRAGVVGTIICRPFAPDPAPTLKISVLPAQDIGPNTELLRA